jgi:hypothetical protein
MALIGDRVIPEVPGQSRNNIIFRPSYRSAAVNLSSLCAHLEFVGARKLAQFPLRRPVPVDIAVFIDKRHCCLRAAFRGSHRPNPTSLHGKYAIPTLFEPETVRSSFRKSGPLLELTSHGDDILLTMVSDSCDLASPHSYNIGITT